MEADMRAAAILLSYVYYCTFRAYAMPVAQQRPLFYHCGGVMFTARNMWDASQELRTWIGRSVQVTLWIGLLSGQVWGGLALPPSISCQMPLSFCLPPMFYFFSPYTYDTRPKGALRIAALVYRGTPASQSLVSSESVKTSWDRLFPSTFEQSAHLPLCKGLCVSLAPAWWALDRFYRALFQSSRLTRLFPIARRCFALALTWR